MRCCAVSHCAPPATRFNRLTVLRESARDPSVCHEDEDSEEKKSATVDDNSGDKGIFRSE